MPSKHRQTQVAFLLLLYSKVSLQIQMDMELCRQYNYKGTLLKCRTFDLAFCLCSNGCFHRLILIPSLVIWSTQHCQRARPKLGRAEALLKLISSPVGNFTWQDGQPHLWFFSFLLPWWFSWFVGLLFLCNSLCAWVNLLIWGGLISRSLNLGVGPQSNEFFKKTS